MAATGTHRPVQQADTYAGGPQQLSEATVSMGYVISKTKAEHLYCIPSHRCQSKFARKTRKLHQRKSTPTKRTLQDPQDPSSSACHHHRQRTVAETIGVRAGRTSLTYRKKKLSTTMASALVVQRAGQAELSGMCATAKVSIRSLQATIVHTE